MTSKRPPCPEDADREIDWVDIPGEQRPKGPPVISGFALMEALQLERGPCRLRRAMVRVLLEMTPEARARAGETWRRNLETATEEGRERLRDCLAALDDVEQAHRGD
jgi:hypothetical protein